jgi:hypothetical protein
MLAEVIADLLAADMEDPALDEVARRDLSDAARPLGR